MRPAWLSDVEGYEGAGVGMELRVSCSDSVGD